MQNEFPVNANQNGLPSSQQTREQGLTKGKDRPGIFPRPPIILPALAILLLTASSASASIFKGETLDKVSDILSWVVLVIAPIIGIAVFWLVHILPEKIAEKKHHPQAKAIQVLCLLSLVFGGLLWPLAWLWAYTKPVLHQLAYGTDKAIPEHGSDEQSSSESILAEELELQRKRVAELEGKLAAIKAATE